MTRPLALVLALVLLPGAARAQEPAPQRSEVIERTGRRIVQIDVSVRGPRDAVADLRPEDFRVVVGTENVERFVVDRLCGEPGPAPEPTVVEQELETTDAPPAPPGSAAHRPSYLLYFDQEHLTLGGRAESLDRAREMIPELVQGGGRVTLVSNGEELETFAELESDPGALLAAVDALAEDKDQWAIHATEEPQRVQEIIEALEEGDLSYATSVARRHQLEETWRGERALRRFALVLARLADLPPPKVVLYFADTMRRNPGEHFLSFFGATQQAEQALQNVATSTFQAQNAFDALIDEAAAHGIRVYTVQAEGLTADSGLTLGSQRTFAGASPTANQTGRRDAQDALVSLARESGGEAFLRGVRTSKIIEAIERDLGCLYLISIDAQDLPLDRSLPLAVRVERRGVEVHARGRLMVQSESARLTSRLLAAFAAPSDAQNDLPLEGTIVPTGFADGRYTALVQVAPQPSPLADASWDLGLSLVARGRVSEEASGQVQVPAAGVPVVFEREVTLSPGPFEIVAVAHESTGNRVASEVIEGDWGYPTEMRAFVTPVAVLQPRPAVFLRGEEVRRNGALAIAEDQAAAVESPTAFVALVCRDRGGQRFSVERRLIGATVAPFEEMELPSGESGCWQVRDVVPAGSMTSGEFRYEIRIRDANDEEVAVGVRDLVALTADERRSLTGRGGSPAAAPAGSAP